MPRKLFEGMELGNSDPNIEYTPPEEKLIDSGLVNRLVEHYIEERDKGRLDIFDGDDFKSEVQTLKSLIKEGTDKPNPQLLLDTLTVMLKDESYTEESDFFPRTYYLTAVIQALYNLNYADEFVIDIRDWGGEMYNNNTVGDFLKGKPDKPLTLNVYGDFGFCGYRAENCSFIIHNKVIYGCGTGAEYCTFDLMPDAEVWSDGLYDAEPSRGNIVRRMKENGEWEIIDLSSLWSSLW